MCFVFSGLLFFLFLYISLFPSCLSKRQRKQHVHASALFFSFLFFSFLASSDDSQDDDDDDDDDELLPRLVGLCSEATKEIEGSRRFSFSFCRRNLRPLVSFRLLPLCVCVCVCVVIEMRREREVNDRFLSPGACSTTTVVGRVRTCVRWSKLVIACRGVLLDDLVATHVVIEGPPEAVPKIFWAKCCNFSWKPRLGLAFGFFLHMYAQASCLAFNRGSSLQSLVRTKRGERDQKGDMTYLELELLMFDEVGHNKRCGTAAPFLAMNKYSRRTIQRLVDKGHSSRKVLVNGRIKGIGNFDLHVFDGFIALKIILDIVSHIEDVADFSLAQPLPVTCFALTT